MQSVGSLRSHNFPPSTMPKKPRNGAPGAALTRAGNAALATPYQAPRNGKGQFIPGFSGSPGNDPARARKGLNADTIREMHAAFRRGGRKAIDKVMKQQPAVFLKLLVLLVPRELEVTHSSGVKGLSDEQIEATIEAIQTMLERRAGEGAKVIEGEAARDGLAPPVDDNNK